MRILVMALILGLAACSEPVETSSREANAELAALDAAAAAPSPAAPLPPMPWRYATSRNHATKSNIVYAKLESVSATDGKFYTIDIRHERPGVTEGFLTQGRSYFCEGAGDESITVDVAGTSKTMACQPSRTNHGASAFGYDQTTLLNRMSDADEMIVTLNRSGGQKTEVIFNPEGFTLTPENAPDMSEVIGQF